jgi:hypothetical protein
MKDAGDNAPEIQGHALNRGTRRALAARILAMLEHNAVSYGVIRNPRRLLDEGRGDLDIWVPAKSMQSAIHLMERKAEAEGWWLLKRVQRPYVSGLCLYRPGRSPSALTVDVFPAIRWLVADLLPETVLAESLTKQADVWVLDPRVGALASCLHYLAWNGTVPSRYLRSYPGADAVRGLPYSDLLQEIANDPEPDWGRFRRRLLATAIAKEAIFHPLRAGGNALLTLASFARSSPGRWVAFEGPMADRYLTEIHRKLQEEHFLVGRWSSTHRVPRGWLVRQAWYAKEVRIKRWLGTIVLSSGNLAGLRPDLNVRIDSSGWRTQIQRASQSSQGDAVHDLFLFLLGWLASECRIEISPSRGTTGIIVAITGSNGSERASLARQLASEARLQPAAQHLWRPVVLQTPGLVAGDGSGSTEVGMEARQGVLSSLRRLGHYWFSTQWRFATTLRRQRKAGMVVLVEGSLLDVIRDPARYGIRLPRQILELVARISFRPQLLLDLSAPSSRKGDGKLPILVPEADRQTSVSRTLPLQLVDTRNLDAGTAPIDLARQAAKVIDAVRKTS